MITVLKEYIKLRIDLKQLLGLTLLMAFLILSLENTKLDWCYTIVFLFISFFHLTVLPFANLAQSLL